MLLALLQAAVEVSPEAAAGGAGAVAAAGAGAVAYRRRKAKAARIRREAEEEQLAHERDLAQTFSPSMRALAIRRRIELKGGKP